MPRLPLRLLFVLLMLAACGGNDSNDDINGPDPDPDPDPEFDIDIVRFRVWTLEAGGAERLRWVGTSEGPLEDSPEDTRWPWIGYARAFRVDWKAFSEDLPILGTQYRVSQLSYGPWLPQNKNGEALWGQENDFVFENLLVSDELFGESCPEGTDCTGQLRFESGRHRLQVKAITEDAREIDEGLGVLEFEINYPPSIGLVTDPATGPEDPEAAPIAFWSQTDGSVRYVALSEGDTIPSGATVRVRVRGADRVRSTTDTDSFCCDDQLDPDNSEVSFYAMTYFVREDFNGVRVRHNTQVGPTSTDSVLTMNVGPYDYEAVFRAKDEHGRPGESVGFNFVAGYPPQLPTTTTADGAQALLSPVRDSAPGEITVVRGDRAIQVWDADLNDWFAPPGPGTQMEGTWYEIGIAFRGAPHPAIANVSPVPPPEASEFSKDYSDHVRSFTYELIHENDPYNANTEGPGDRDNLFVSVDELGELDLIGEKAWRIFIPDLVFTNLEFFDPAGACVEGDFCDIGERLLEQLGEFELRLRSQTTHILSEFEQEAPQARRDLNVDLGRFSPWMTGTLSVRLALHDENDQFIGVWPSESP